MIQSYDIVIIGGGVLGKTLAFFLSRKNPDLRMALISCEKNYPSCSLKSTGIVSSFGIREGVSQLGDHLFHAHLKANEFFSSFKPDGIELSKHFFIGTNKIQWERITRRFGAVEKYYLSKDIFAHHTKCYLVSPNKYLNWLKENTNCEYYDRQVTSINKNCIKTSDGRTISSQTIVLTTGAYSIMGIPLLSNHREIEESSIVAGTYAVFKNISLGKKSFVLSLDGANLVYRKEEKKLLLGATSDKGSSLVPNRKKLSTQYNMFSKIIKLPPLESAQLEVGLRHKCRKRMPFVGQLSNNLYGILGGYKNGYTIAPWAAEKIAKLI